MDEHGDDLSHLIRDVYLYGAVLSMVCRPRLRTVMMLLSDMP